MSTFSCLLPPIAHFAQQKSGTSNTKRSKSDSSKSETKTSLEKIYTTCLAETSSTSSLAIRQLEAEGCIETTLWPLFLQHTSQKNEDWSKPSKSLLKLILARNDSTGRSNLNGPLAFMLQDSQEEASDAFSFFISQLVQLGNENYHLIVQFLITAYNNMTLEMQPIVRQSLLDVVGIGLWQHMPKRYRDLLIARSTAFKRRWEGKIANENEEDMKESTFIPQLLSQVEEYFMVFESADEDSDMEDEMIAENESESDEHLPLIYSTLQLLIDLLSSTSTRRYLRPYLLSTNFSIKCKLSHFNKRKNDKHDQLLHALTRTLQQLECFAIEDISAAPLSEEEMNSVYHERVHILQKMCHRYYPDALSDIIYAGVGMCADETFLRKVFARVVEDEILIDLCHRLRLVDREESEDQQIAPKRKFLEEVLVYHHALKQSETKFLSSLPLYPDERLLWNQFLVPMGNDRIQSDSTLALPRMGLQYLTFSDYLLRSFKLLRLESAYEIRNDLVDVVRRMRPARRHGYVEDVEYADEDDMWIKRRKMTQFHGWSRMGLELVDEETASPVTLVKVSPPKLGEKIPGEVLAEIVIDLKHCGHKIRQEWDSIGEFDNLFLIGVDATKMEGGPLSSLEDGEEDQVADEDDITFPRRTGIVAVRGCMVLQVRDELGNILSDPYAPRIEVDPNDKQEESFKRILKVALDPAQYAIDATGGGSPYGTKVYQTLNVVVRRQGKENNFKAILETVRGLMKGSGSVNRSIPRWLQPVLLGFGNPASASFNSQNMIKFAQRTVGVTPPDAALDYGDTFVSEAHLRDSFEGKLIVDGLAEKEESDFSPRKKYRIKMEADKGSSTTIVASSYEFPASITGNSIPFTPVQVKAIRSGLSPGLTMIVGPPGTGKTDVAVQIIANLYHSFPTQRTVLITHSNAALNDLFEKVMARGDIDERYCLRLGAGERDLQTETEFDFTKTGRVNHILARRAALLEEVQLISESLGVSGVGERAADGSASYTCETSSYFERHHIQKHIHKFEMLTSDESFDGKVGDVFPFAKYFKLTDEEVSSLTIDRAQELFCKLKQCFQELEEYRPLELLRSQKQRIDYLLTKQVKIVAMTCTHAAIARSHLVELGFQYDNLVVEEAGQMLDIETFVPMLLQRGDLDTHSRLKRICLIGDHHQLPPVIKNMTFSHYSNFDQSLFTRLIKSGVPTIELDKQGRARTEIASLYTWRYKNLKNLDHVTTAEKFLCANPGFVNTFQMINVEDYEGRGESTPTPYFYQNKGEAEYTVALFQYMVLIGYDPSKISILTTYNGQKSLIEDIVSQRCGEGTPLGGVRPGAISTVDKYQGQQNDYVILSLVRSKSVGHLRDIRRLIVAVSRSRLGLYICCRQSIFQSCHELKPVMDQLVCKSTKLKLVMGEEATSSRKLDDDLPTEKKFTVEDVTALGDIVHSMQEAMVTGDS